MAKISALQFQRRANEWLDRCEELQMMDELELQNNNGTRKRLELLLEVDDLILSLDFQNLTIDMAEREYIDLSDEIEHAMIKAARCFDLDPIEEFLRSFKRLLKSARRRN